MKKIFSILLAFVAVFALSACADLEDISTDLTGLHDDIDGLQATIDTLQSEIDALETILEDLGDIGDDVDALEAQLTALEAQLTVLEGAVDDLPTTGDLPAFAIDLGTLTMTEGDLTEDLTLPTLTGAEIIWTTSDSTVLTSDGKVIRPNLGRGDVEVTLSAIVLDGNLAATKSFVFNVLSEASDDELILDFVNNLPDEIDGHVDLPTEFGDITVTWSSTNEDIIATDGFVRLPHLEDDDKHVTLSTSMVLDGFVREFSKTITVLKEPVAISGAVGNPFVATLTTDEGHMLHIPVENIDRDFNYLSTFSYLYTPEYGDRIPSNINGWGLALEIKEDGSLIAIYDGISGVKRLPDGTTEPWKAGDHFTKDPDSCVDPADWTTCEGLEIPADGYIIVFHNDGVNFRHNREFARKYVNNSDRTFTIEGVTLTPSTMHYEITGGVWWRGNATVSVPKAFINPDVNTFNYSDVVVLDPGFYTGFEDVVKASYVADTVTIDDVDWMLDDALVGNLDNDKTVGDWALRFRNDGFMESQATFSKVTRIELVHASYGTEASATVMIELSKDGTTWVEVASFTTGEDLKFESVNINYWAAGMQAAEITASDSVYVRISKTGGNRVNIDELKIYDTTSPQVAGAPVIFTKSYVSTIGAGQGLDPNNFDIKNGWGIAAEITPELREIQTIGTVDDEIKWVLDNPWTITRVYDAIGGNIKNPPPTGNVPVGGGDYGKNVRLVDEGYVIVFPGTIYGYASDQDVLNRRIGADFFYHLENWIYDPILTEEDELIAPTRVMPWPFE